MCSQPCKGEVPFSNCLKTAWYNCNVETKRGYTLTEFARSCE